MAFVSTSSAKLHRTSRIDSAIARLGLGGSVTQTPPVTHNESLRLLAASHVLVVVQPHTRVQVPAKLYEYVGLRRPILALAEEGAVARVVRDSDFGIVVSPTNIDGIAAALNELYRSTHALFSPASAIRARPSTTPGINRQSWGRFRRLRSTPSAHESPPFWVTETEIAPVRLP